MKIFIMRHGEAHHIAASDAERELTERGRTQSIIVAQDGKKQGIKAFDLVLVSPYIRAQQTWESISGVFDTKEKQTCHDITPYGDSKKVVSYVSALAQVNRYESILMVSHLPLVGHLTAEFVNGIQPPIFTTSSLACVELEPETQKGELLWCIRP